MTTIPRWEKYKGFFQITIFRYLVLWFSLVPVVVTLFEGLQRPLVIPWDHKIISLQLAMPFSWQLLWLSSLLFFVALGLYHLRCPAFIKKYNNFSEYQSYSHDPRWLSWEAKSIVEDTSLIDKFTNRLLTKKFLDVLPSDFTWNQADNPSVQEHQTKLYFEASGNKLALSMPVLDENSEAQPAAEKGIFWEIFGRFSESRYWSRLTIFVLLILSGFFFLIVLYQHIAFGVRELCEWIQSTILLTAK